MLGRKCCIVMWVAATLLVACGPEVAKHPSTLSVRIYMETDTTRTLQPDVRLAVGDEVRGRTPKGPPIQGFVALLTDTVLDVRVKRSALPHDSRYVSPQTVRRVNLVSLERLEERRNPTRKAFVICTLAGGLLGVVSGQPSVAVIGLLSGSFAGYAVGTASASETWVSIENVVTPTLDVAPVGEPGGGVLAPAHEPRVYSGDRVRIPAADGGTKPLVGTVARIGNDTLTLNVKGRKSAAELPVGSLSMLELSLGPKSRWAGLGKGLGLGFLAGAVLGGGVGYLGGDEGENEDNGPLLFSTAQENAVFLGVVFGALFGVIGGTIGALNPGERWEVVEPLDFSAGVTPEQEAGFFVTMSRRF